jgi:hypothetical protein
MEQVIELSKGQAFPVVLLMVAIFWMQRMNADLIARLHAERTDRLDKLEAAIEECERDRKDLWVKLLKNSEA